MQEYIIIVAGGTGSRMGSSLPKQFLTVHNKTILVHTLEKFFAYNPEIKIIVACHKEYISLAQELIQQQSYSSQINIIEGGETRFHSVKNGLDSITDLNAIVGVHDAARPLVSTGTIARCYSIAKEKGNALPVVPVSESIRKKEAENSKAVNRNEYCIVQTPQCFQSGLIKEAFKSEYSDLFTDDATVLEKAGHKINLVEGNPENIKITHRVDLAIAEVLLK